MKRLLLSTLVILPTLTGAALAQSGPPGMPALTRPISQPVETSAPARNGGALSLGAPKAAPTSETRPTTTRVDTSASTRSTATPVPAGLASAALDQPMTLPGEPVGAAMELADSVGYQRSTIGVTSAPMRPAPSTLSIKSGRNEMVQVARNHLNRFVTPFRNPEVRTTAAVTTTKVEGSIVYVATASHEPVSVFIIDGDSPVNAFSLTLMPRDVPAVSVSLQMDGPLAMQMASAAEGPSFETADDFVSGLRETFRALAQGEVPSGFGMRPVDPRAPGMPECVLPGLQATPAQEISSGSVVIIVSKLTNRSGIPQSVDESRCASDRTLAVAAWPHVELLPGQSTELFIALRRSAAPAGNARPSVLSY
ncbi:MAG: hypothetical protein A2580_14970 [Hydrogenophilales bacterium RIFOXYD1_FULL_62_11]|nr:MAG: hypothetical protein A2580_14970 [Hydrogenophilales bacterium RIFOXYD1_FULL_62_11]